MISCRHVFASSLPTTLGPTVDQEDSGTTRGATGQAFKGHLVIERSELWKIAFFLGKSSKKTSIYGPFSIAMWNNQRVVDLSHTIRY